MGQFTGHITERYIQANYIEIPISDGCVDAANHGPHPFNIHLTSLALRFHLSFLFPSGTITARLASCVGALITYVFHHLEAYVTTQTIHHIIVHSLINCFSIVQTIAANEPYKRQIH